MLVLMAGCALAGKPKISLTEVLDQNSASRRNGNEFSFVAVPARNSSMLTREREARLAVVHGLAARIPVNDLKIRAVMLRMAGRTILAGSIRFYPDGMHPAPLGNPFPNFRVAL